MIVPATAVTDSSITITIPATPAAIPAGLWSVTADVTNTVDSQTVTSSTNTLALAVAPRITNPMPASVQRDVQHSAVIALTCEPDVLAGQPVTLIVGDRSVPEQRTLTGDPVDGDTLSFVVTNAPLGEHLLRLRVAGVDSRLVDRSQTTPQFDASQKLTVTP